MDQEKAPIQVPSILYSLEEDLAKGANATEFQEIVNHATKIIFQPEAHHKKSVGYAWNAGREFRRIKSYIRRGLWTDWKAEADRAGFGSTRKIEMYMMIAGEWDTEEEASAAAPSIASAVALITAKRREERKRLK